MKADVRKTVGVYDRPKKSKWLMVLMIVVALVALLVTAVVVFASPAIPILHDSGGTMADNLKQTGKQDDVRINADQRPGRWSRMFAST